MKLKNKEDKLLLDNVIFKCIIVSIQKFSSMFIIKDDKNDSFIEKNYKAYARGMRKIIPILDKLGKGLTSPPESRKVSLLETNKYMNYLLCDLPSPNYIYEFMYLFCYGPPNGDFKKDMSFCRFEDSCEDVCYFLNLLKNGLTTEQDKYDYYLNDPSYYEVIDE